MASKAKVSRIRKTNKARQDRLQTLRVQLDSYLNYPRHMQPQQSQGVLLTAEALAEETAYALRQQYAAHCAEVRLLELAELGYSDTRLELAYVRWTAQIENFVNRDRPLGVLK